jgi:hypothetical protein
MVLYGLAAALGSRGAALLVPESKEKPCSAIGDAKPFANGFMALFSAA